MKAELQRTLIQLQDPMRINYFNSPDGVIVQLAYDFEVFCAQGSTGLKVMEKLAKELGCDPLVDGVHGKGSYFFLSPNSNEVIAKGFIKFTDINEVKF
jgi:hypothetical protein